MASLNQVSIELKVSGEREATQALKRYSSASERLTRSVLDAASKIESTTNAWNRANKLYEKGVLNANALKAAQTQLARELAVTNGYLKSNGALNTQKALAELKAAQATQEAAAAEARANAERQRAQQSYNQLRATIDQSYNVRMRLRQAAQTLRAAEQQGIITREQAIAQLREYRTVAQQAAIGTQFASRRLNSFGVVAQQTGYQVGDFLVQIQGGTNVFVALGQQLTQLIGTFGIFAKTVRAAMIVSGIGILVPILTAIGAAFMRTREETEDTEDEMQTLSNTISKLNTIQRTVAIDFERGLNAAFAESANSVSKLLDQLREAEFRSAMQPIKDSFDEITVGVDRLDAALNMMVGFDNAINSGQELSVAQQQLLDRSRNLVEENLSLAISYDNVRASLDAITESKSTQELITNFAKALEIAEALPGPIAGELVDALLEAAREAGLLEQIISKSEGAADDTAVAVDRIADRARAASQAAYGIFQALRAASMAMGATEAGIAAAQRTAARGAPEMEVRATQAAATREAELTAMGVSGAELTSQVALAFSNEMRRLQSEAAERALYAGFADTGGGGGGGGAGATGFVSMFPELQAAFEQAQELAKAYGEEVKILDFALEEGLITQQEYNSYVAQAQEAYNQSAEAANQYEDIILRMANTTSDAIGQAMMDIVTGTKSASDAFSDMAQIILKKAFELLVINPIINSIFGGSGLDIDGFNLLPSIVPSANGNVFSGGNVQAFATGGVVGSPTFFPMANGNVGLMGEAGPEAIMPLKRGKGGRLGVEVSGEQGNVVINQTFAFQANGDDSVKRIIASEAPKIAALTQKQMLDARRRGGVVRDTFA